MQKKVKDDNQTASDLPGADADATNGEDDVAFKVADRRHWTQDDEDGGVEEAAEVEPAQPTIIDQYRMRAEAAEQKLQEYIEAFKMHKDEQEQFRVRLTRDVDRRVNMKFAELVHDLLETMDNLDLALAHVGDAGEAAPLVEGVRLARDRFLSSLDRRGVEKISPEQTPFDPEEAEAMRMDPVDSAEQDGMVTETLRPGYRIGDCLIRPARVAVGRATSTKS